MQFLTTPGTVAFRTAASGALLPLSAPTVNQQGAVPVGGEIGISPINISFDAQWLDVVEQRIKASIPAEGCPQAGNGAWLRPQVGRAALEFFRGTSTALPGEPYIYSSKAGDLVAEFTAPRGKMTCLISQHFVVVFAATEDEIIEKKYLPKEQGTDTLRSDIQAVSKLLGASPNGTVEPRI